MAAGRTPISSSASSTAICAMPRAPPPPSASAKVFIRSRLPREFPRLRGERTHHQRHARRRSRSSPCRRAIGRRCPAGWPRGGRNCRRDRWRDAGADRGRCARDRPRPRQRAPECRGAPRSRPSERAEADARRRRRHVPGHQVVGEIGERIAQRRQLPVEHGSDRRRRRRDDDVVEAVVAMHEPHRRGRRQMRAAARRSAAPCRRSARSARRGTAGSSARPGARRNSRRGRNRQAQAQPDRRRAAAPAWRWPHRRSRRARAGAASGMCGSQNTRPATWSMR